MKSIFAALALVTALSAEAQSFLVQESGKLLTIDKQGFIYDLEQTVVPDDIKLKGKNWFITKNNEMTVIGGDGLVTKKVGMALPKSIKASGGSWLVGDKSEFVVVNSDGMVYSYVEPLMNKVKVLAAGANWLVIRARDKSVHILTLDSVNGRYFAASAVMMQQGPLALNINNIRIKGNNWFTDANGILFVVRKDGGIQSKREMGIFLGATSRGGNFFIDVRGGVQVVLDNGFVALPYLPMVFGNMIKSGPNYAWNTQGDFFTFAEAAGPNEQNAATDKQALDRLLRGIIKQPMNMQIDMRSVVQD